MRFGQVPDNPPKENSMNETEKDLLPEPPGDAVSIRCPRLGHQINFSYCRYENSGLPCFKTLDCWFSYFDVQACLRKKLTPEEFQTAFRNKTAPKLLSLLDLIEQAKQRKEGSD